MRPSLAMEKILLGEGTEILLAGTSFNNLWLMMEFLDEVTEQIFMERPSLMLEWLVDVMLLMGMVAASLLL